MTFATLPAARTNVPDRTETGRVGVRFPASGKTETPITLGGCRTCDKQAAHGSPCAQIGNILEAGEKRHDGIPATQHSNADVLQEVSAGLYAAGWTINGIPRGTLYNLGAGTANNISQDIRCRIVAVNVGGNARRMTLRIEPDGTNPKAWLLGTSRVNPEWPLEQPRLLTDGSWIVVPVGCQVEFAFPSVLHGKCRPMVTKIIPPGSDDPDGVNFDVICSHAVSRATSPYDKLFPAPNYYCELVFHGVAPETWPNWQRSHETTFTKRTIEVTAATLVSDSYVVALKRSDGENGKVLFPSMATFFVQWFGDNNLYGTLSPAEAKDKLTSEYTGGEWVTTLNLDNLTGETDLVKVQITFCPEAVNADTMVFPFPDRCANAQRDWTQSYTQNGEHRCMNYECDRFADFKADCWFPKASKFAIGVETGRVPQSDSQRERWFARNWSRTSFVLEQGVPGSASHRNFSYRRPSNGGPSIQEWVGGFRDDVPKSPVAASAEPLFPARLGQRHQYTDSGGNINHRIVYGAFYARKWIPDGDDVETLPFDGYTEDVLNWSARKSATGATVDSVARVYPLDGPEPCNVATYANGGSTYSLKKFVSDDAQEMFVVRIPMTQSNPTLAEEIRNAIP